MKKILVVLLVLAVATGVFAQEGSWSLNGKVEIGTFIDFDNNPEKLAGDNPDNSAVYKSSGYWSPYNYYGPVNGQLGLGYSRDELWLGLTFNTLDSDIINAGFTYDGGNYKFEVNSSLDNLIRGKMNVGRLWGYYKMVNEMIHLEVAYNSRDTQFWTSDLTGAFGGAGGIGWPVIDVVSRIGQGDSPWDSYASPWGGDRESFTKVDHGNYLLGDVQLSNLSFGIMLRSIFVDNDFATADNTTGWLSSDNSVDTTFPKAVGKSGGYKFVDEVLKKVTIGLKFDMQPIQIAAQFRMGDYGAYFGGKWFIGPVTVGMSFMGVLKPYAIDDGNLMKFGGGVEYNPGVFGAEIKAWYGIAKFDSDNRATQIGLEPAFFYNVIPTHLQFRTDVGFYFNGGKTGGTKDDIEVTWAVQPQLFWNFLGTGAGSYYSYNTGIIVRYRLVSDAVNAFDVGFRFAF